MTCVDTTYLLQLHAARAERIAERHRLGSGPHCWWERLICPTTHKPYTAASTTVDTGALVWVLCEYCDAGDGGRQPHPYEVAL